LKLFLDFDTDDCELVLQECMRLKALFNLGKCEIKRGNNFMAKFERELTEKELLELIRIARYVDRGYKYWVEQHNGVSCLRVSDKVIVKQWKGRRLGRKSGGAEPYLWKVV